MSQPRTDIHRESAFDPEAYEYLFSYSFAGAGGDPGYNTELLAATQTGAVTFRAPVWGMTESGYPIITGWEERGNPFGRLDFFRQGGGQCDLCGAHFLHGEVLRHRPTGEAIHIGNICAAKADCYTRDEWQEAHRAKVQRMMATRGDHTARIAQIRKWARANRDLLADLRVDHRITKDIRSRLLSTACKWGLSEKQVALVRKLARQEAEKASRPAEVKIAAPVTGDRIVIEGTVVSAKEQVNDYGVRFVMTVKVETAEGVWLTWGSVPNSLGWSEGQDPVKVGDTVRFTAKVNVSDRDESFSFFKRPTKAVFVARAQEDAVA